MNSMPVGNNQDLHELTWKEHAKGIGQATRSGRFFGFIVIISFVLMFTVGIVFQIVFLFSFLPTFVILARLGQPFYFAFLFVTNDKTLPRTLPKPPLSAYLLSIIPLLISVFFLYVGIIGFRQTGFCGQSLGCILVALVQRLIST